MSLFSEDDDLDVVWDKLIAQCNDRAGWDLSRDRGPTVEGVLAKMKPPKDSKSKTHEIAKTVFKQTLVCISRFGQIAAQAASTVFGPSQQCFNAISFVISAVQDYDAVFSNVTVLMERVSVFLERLRIYLDDTQAETKVDKHLRLTMYRVLEHFMTVLSIWHKLTSSRTARLKLAAKVTVFGEDEGVKSSIQKLEVLIQNFTGAEISLMGKTISNAARNILTVERKLDAVADSSERATASLGRIESAEEQRKQRKKICEAMGIDTDRRAWVLKQDELCGKQTLGTGKWLLEYEQSASSFVRWSDSKAPHLTTLSIAAEGGYGKSYLCSIVVDHLREKYSGDPRVCIGFYYLQRDTSDKSPINNAIKAIIYQLASAPTSASREYAKLIHKACDGKDFGKTADLWKQLVAAFAKSLNATFFIVLDGVDEPETEADRPLSSIINQIMSIDEGALLKIRLLIAGRPDGLDAFKELKTPIPSIILASADKAPLNEGDLLLHAQRRLDAMTCFETTDKSLLKLKDRARDELAAGARGNYIALESKLDSVAKCHDDRDVEDVISRAQETRTEEIARKIKRLNTTLSEGQKTELNEMLAWAAACIYSLDLEQYKAVLLLKTGTKVLGSLETQIRNMYNFLFTIDDQKKLSLCADIEEYLAVDEEIKSSSTSDNSHRALEAIQDSELSLVKRLLRTHFRNVFGDDETYTRFAFDEFFESKRSGQIHRIHLKAKPEIHLRLAQACLIALCDDHAGEDYSASLQQYAWDCFAEHLLRAKDAEHDQAAMQDIGRKLMRLLRDPALIDAWWNDERISEVAYRCYWVYVPDYTQAVCSWLKRPTVQKVLQDMPTDRQWVLENIGDDKRAVAIMTDVAKRVAQRWFDLKERVWKDAFEFTIGYLTNMRGAASRKDSPAQGVLMAEEWGKKELGNGDATAQWNFCIAETLRYRMCHTEAIDRYHQAIATGTPDWRLQSGLAKALRANKQPEEAVKELEKLIENNPISSDSNTPDGYKDAFWGDIMPELAQSFVDRKNFDRAEAIYRTILDESFRLNDFPEWAKEAVTGLAEAFHEQGKHRDIVQLLNDLVKRPDDEVGNWLCQLLHYNAELDIMHDRIHAAARSADSLDFIAESYHSAMESARSMATNSNNLYGTFLFLRYQLAALLWSSQLPEDQAVALQLWEANIEGAMPEDIEDDWTISWARSNTFAKLTLILSEAAKAGHAEGGSGLEIKPHIDNLVRAAMADTDDLGNSAAAIARLLLVTGDGDRARDVVRDKMKVRFEDIDGDPDKFEFGYWTRWMAGVLQAFDDDANAIAAWCLGMPEKNEDTDEKAASEASSLNGERQATSGTASGEVAEAAAEPVPTNGVTTSEVEDAKSETSKTSAEPALEGPLWYRCDGACGVEWTYANDFWACKDCADVQFDPVCYEKLKAGTLTKEVCGQHHSHIFIPPFDKERWLSTPNDKMWVDGALVAKRDWVEGIKKKWQIDKESLAAKKIQSAWRGYSAATAPGEGLTRRQTVAAF